MTTPDSPDASRPDADGPQRTPLADDRALDRRDAVEVIRSEERLDVSTVVRASGRAVLRRYVVTETVTQTFEVRHEEFRVDHEPFLDGQRADGVDLIVDERAFGDRFVETVLHREVPVVTMQVVAAERVRVHVDTVTDQVRVSEEVARERVDVDVLDHVETSGGA